MLHALAALGTTPLLSHDRPPFPTLSALGPTITVITMTTQVACDIYDKSGAIILARKGDCVPCVLNVRSGVPNWLGVAVDKTRTNPRYKVCSTMHSCCCLDARATSICQGEMWCEL